MGFPEELTFGQLLYGGIGFMLLAGGILLAFLVLYQKRLLLHQLRLRTIQTAHQQDLLRVQQQLLLAVIAAQEGEREHIGQDLHDGIGSILATAKLLLYRLDQQVAQEEFAHLLGLVKELISTAVQEVRGISHNLYPAVLARFGLAEAIQHLTDTCNETGKLPIELTLDYFQPLDLDQELALYRICQELVSNAIKHARGATRLAVRLQQQGSLLKLVVEDNGCGFSSQLPPTGSSAASGNGLRNINVRVQMLQAQLHLDTDAGQGTRITIELNSTTLP
ncbi:Signal transduction histidine kinase [Hymenobacter daecheongensis DSM 21074]|uniref:Signal transduction histidine kinase n=1 Tax=Hymenobacter daecheongensis DSM 21074 TaxID=1121955 RepID=A0A1M6I2P1_9BACT|nr:sensor histidine kinase [Hymenobacter daecheongensis]SHJ28660.1 Signal transduction histidine kinase [Hymenobacter daecheongensis DSM 21074]